MENMGDEQEEDDNKGDYIGGRKDDRSNKNKGKAKLVDKELVEDEKPRNQKYMENESKSGKSIKLPADGFDLRMNWDWRWFRGIISNLLDQRDTVICWAIAFIRAIEALFNIAKRIENQQSFSIQHLVNNVKVGGRGLYETATLREFVLQNGILDEAECSYTRTKGTCDHQNPKLEMIDDVTIINNVDDVELARLVWMHPVVGVLPLSVDLQTYSHGIYRSTKRDPDELPAFHAVLIIGFGVDDNGNYYWLIQNSWGSRWGEEGYGRIHREIVRGRSMFTQVYYGNKKGYPQCKRK